MSRGYYVNGETMTYVKGRSDLALISSRTELGLTDQSIRIQIKTQRLQIRVDAMGDAPPESQFMGASASVSMTLVHFDSAVLDACIQESWGSSPARGQLGHAGSLMGSNKVLFAPGGIDGNHFISLNLVSAPGKQSWRFFHSTLSQNPIEWPIGTERSLVTLNWDSLPYTIDPWNSGNGSYGIAIWDNGNDA
jgi:hypothetical protein